MGCSGLKPGTFLPAGNWGQGPLNLGKIACGLANWENSVKRNKTHDTHNLIMFKCKFDQRTLKLVKFDPVPEAVYTH